VEKPFPAHRTALLVVLAESLDELNVGCRMPSIHEGEGKISDVCTALKSGETVLIVIYDLIEQVSPL
jgi:hypothetical protein